MGNCRIESGVRREVQRTILENVQDDGGLSEPGLREPLPTTVERSRAGLDRLVGHVVYGSTVDIITIITRP